MTTIDTAALAEPAEERGRRARALLDDPVLDEGFQRLEQDLIAAWRGSAPQAREAREQLYLRLAALGSLRQELRLIAEEGLLAERRRVSEAREAQARRAGGFAAGDPP
jgi:hypothetical protein